MEETVKEDITENINKVALLINNIENVIKGHREHVVRVVTCLLAKGHILLEDNPGSGKTVMAKTLAHSISGGKEGEGETNHASFKRIQFTPDLLPMDLLGSHIYNEKSNDFVFKKGPLFTNILLSDEINRASPKVQSALLECMEEHQISIGNQTYPLADLFFVIATQNPIEMEGTYPLPNAQLDRFFMKISFGYVTEDIELDIYKKYIQINDFQENIKQVINMDDILALQKEADKVHVHEAIIKSVNSIIRSTREHPGISLGASVRSGIILLKCLKAYAFINNRTYVIEDDLNNIVKPVIQHRLLFKNKMAETDALDNIVRDEVKKLTKLSLAHAKNDNI
jgi:MoxR-like ATPase